MDAMEKLMGVMLKQALDNPQIGDAVKRVSEIAQTIDSRLRRIEENQEKILARLEGQQEHEHQGNRIGSNGTG